MAIEVRALRGLDLGHLARRPRGRESGGDANEELTRRERLGDVVIGPGRQAPGRLLLAGARGEKDDGDPAQPLVGPQGRHERKAVEAGHHHVAQDERGGRAPDALQRRGAVAHRLHEPALAEEARHVVAHVGVVVGKDDAVTRVVASRLRCAPFVELRVPARRLVDEDPGVDGGRWERSRRAQPRGRQMRCPARDAHAERRARPDACS